MKIKCGECNRPMNIGELSPYLLIYLSKKLAPVIAPLFIKALEHYLTLPTKSFFDDSMASLANIAEVECPQCKKKVYWNPAPELEPVQEQPKKENRIVVP